MSLTKSLRNWREDRNITSSDYKVFVSNVLEELLEPIYHKDEIPTMVSEIMSGYFNDVDYNDLKKKEIVDAIQDIQVFSINETELMGYNNEKCNNEVFAHINARRQDPKQREEWSKSGAVGKWQKDKSQSKDEIPEPKYELCLI